LLPAIRRAKGEVVWTDLYLVHSGSAQSPEGFQRKLERDFRILHQELAESPNHPFVLFNLGMTYADAANNSASFPPSAGFEIASFTSAEDRGRLGEGETRRITAPISNIPFAQPPCLPVSSSPSLPLSFSDAAIDYLRRCLAASQPDESHLRKAYALLASSLSQAERHDEAWQSCQQGLALYPDDKELLFRSAMLHHHFGRLNEAEQMYLRVLTANTTFTLTLTDAMAP
jgi:hypothetical protein